MKKFLINLLNICAILSISAFMPAAYAATNDLTSTWQLTYKSGFVALPQVCTVTTCASPKYPQNFCSTPTSCQGYGVQGGLRGSEVILALTTSTTHVNCNGTLSTDKSSVDLSCTPLSGSTATQATYKRIAAHA